MIGCALGAGGKKGAGALEKAIWTQLCVQSSMQRSWSSGSRPVKLDYLNVFLTMHSLENGSVMANKLTGCVEWL